MGVVVDSKEPGMNGYVGPDRRYISAVKLMRTEWLFASVALAIVALLSLTPLADDSRPIPELADGAAAFVSIAFALTLVSAALSWFRSFVLRIRDELEAGFLYALVAVGWLGPVYLSRVYDLALPVSEGLFVLGSAASLAGTSLVLLFRHGLVGSTTHWLRRSVVCLAPLLTVMVVGLTTDFDPSRSEVTSALLAILAVLGLGLVSIGWLRNRPSLGFFGLQLTGLSAAEALRKGFTGDAELALACAGLLAAGSSIVGLYGVVVSIRGDLAGRDKRLFTSFLDNQKLAVQMAASQQDSVEQMHSLRSGLLGVEALARSMDDPKGVAAILADEAERLRGLTAEKTYALSRFDLMEDLQKQAEVHLRASSPCTVEGPDSLMVRAARVETMDAVQSLLANAVRHAPGSPVKVRVAITGEPYAAVAVTVEDRGPGIAPKTAKRIFERGFTTHRDGSGIGLAAAKQVAESQGGHVSFQNRIGGGARFTLLIPLSPVGYERPAEPPKIGDRIQGDDGSAATAADADRSEGVPLNKGGRMFAGAGE